MKKMIALLLALSLLLIMLAGCGSSETGETTAATEATTTASEETSTQEPTTEEPTTEEPTTADADGLAGTVNGKVYTNTKADFVLTLNDNWYIYSEAEIAAVIGLTAEVIDDESVSALVESSGNAMVFYAQEDAGSTINIIWEKVGLMGIFLTADTYIDSALATVGDGLAASGFTDIFTEKITVSFAGEDRPAIRLSAAYGGIPIYEIMIPIVCGNYVCVVTLCALDFEACADLLPNFSPVI